MNSTSSGSAGSGSKCSNGNAMAATKYEVSLGV